MRLPKYEEGESLERLGNTIGAILDCGKTVFRTKSLATVSGARSGYIFSAHIAHLVDKKYLFKEKMGERKNRWYRYHVTDWDGLRGCHHLIYLLLECPDKIEEELPKLKQI